MKSLTETYTPLIKNLQALNQEIGLKHSSMHSYTAQEMKNLDQWLGEAEALALDLEEISSIISHHLKVSKTQLSVLRHRVT